MASQSEDKSQAPKKKALDLNALSGLDFGPSWVDGKESKRSIQQFDKRGGDKHRGRGRDGGNRDRRGSGSGGGRPQSSDRRGGGQSSGAGNQRGGYNRQSGEGRGNREGFQRGGQRGEGRRGQPAFFKPTVNVEIYPQDEAFDALVKRLRSTVRTYQLFEIAQLILEKPERFVIVVSSKDKDVGKTAPMYFSIPGHLPFESEEAAINHVIENHMDLFFDIESIEVEPPKGNFQMVNRCSVSGTLLGPPNYHRYQEFVQKNYSNKIQGMAFDRYVSRIETVKDQEQIDAWVESMKEGSRYTLKDRQEGEPESFESLESARFFLLSNRKDKIVGSSDTVRFAGRDIERLPGGDIRRSVEAHIEQQRHFPLDSANNIRGRLRRHKFTVYKKGSKGVSYVCAVKRKFRDSQTTFTNSIQAVMEFIESHPNISASKLPKEYIGIDTEKQNPEKLKVTEEDVAAAAALKAEQVESSPVVEGEDSSDQTVTVAPVDEVAVEAVVPPENAEASTDATPVIELSEDEQKTLNQLMIDLRWLIVEGYVTEYGDGKLFAPPPMPDAKKEVKKKEKSAEPEASEKVAVETPSEPALKEPIAKEEAAVSKTEITESEVEKKTD